MVKKGPLGKDFRDAFRGQRPGVSDGGWQHYTCSSTRRAKKNERDQEAVGKSRGGLTTKIHAAVDSLGNPVRLLLTAGQASEYGQANALIEDFGAEHVLADKGYDSDDFVQKITDMGAKAVIPPRKNRNDAREYDRELYKERNLVERLFQKLKHYRRIATRYERLGRNYQTMLFLGASMVWLA